MVSRNFKSYLLQLLKANRCNVSPLSRKNLANFRQFGEAAIAINGCRDRRPNPRDTGVPYTSAEWRHCAVHIRHTAHGLERIALEKSVSSEVSNDRAPLPRALACNGGREGVIGMSRIIFCDSGLSATVNSRSATLNARGGGACACLRYNCVQ